MQISHEKTHAKNYFKNEFISLVVEKHDFVLQLRWLTLVSQEIYNVEAILTECETKIPLMNITSGVIDLSDCSE